MLYKVREFVIISLLKLVYHVIFDCHLNYWNTVWVQNKNSLNQLFLFKKKALKIISFECRNARSNSLFYRHETVKLHDKIIIKNCFFISISINFDLPSIFNNWFTFSSDSHRYETSCSLKRFLKVNNANTKKYRRNKSLLKKRFLRGVVVITTAKLHSTKPELTFCVGLDTARGVSEIRDGEDLWQWSRLEIRLNAFRRSTIPQKQFVIIIIIIIIIIIRDIQYLLTNVISTCNFYLIWM